MDTLIHSYTSTLIYTHTLAYTHTLIHCALCTVHCIRYATTRDILRIPIHFS
jgi:hypothetical protein